jgi:hypothetical protein
MGEHILQNPEHKLYLAIIEYIFIVIDKKLRATYL